MHHIKGHHSHPTSGPATPLTPNTSEPGSSLCVQPTHNTKQSPLERNPNTEPKDAQRQAESSHMRVAKHLLTCLELDELFIFLQPSI